MKAFLVTAGILLIATFAIAANIDGEWAGQFDGGMGAPMDLDFVFKADGNKLTGTTTGGPGAERIPIKNGKIDGNNISFSVDVPFGDSGMTINYKGVLSGDQIKLGFDMGMGGPPSEFTVKRVK
jgi:hypothetical protein